METREYFCFNETATTEVYTLSLHVAHPICIGRRGRAGPGAVRLAPLLLRRELAVRGDSAVARAGERCVRAALPVREKDRKSTRLNSSHANISYAVFCLKK